MFLGIQFLKPTPALKEAHSFYFCMSYCLAKHDFCFAKEKPRAVSNAEILSSAFSDEKINMNLAGSGQRLT